MLDTLNVQEFAVLRGTVPHSSKLRSSGSGAPLSAGAVTEVPNCQATPALRHHLGHTDWKFDDISPDGIAIGWRNDKLVTFFRGRTGDVTYTENDHIRDDHGSYLIRPISSGLIASMAGIDSVFFINDVVAWYTETGTPHRNTLAVDVRGLNPKYIVRCQDPNRPPFPNARPVPTNDPMILAGFETQAYRDAVNARWPADRLKHVQRYHDAEYKHFLQRRFWVLPTLKNGRFHVDFCVVERAESACNGSIPLVTIDDAGGNKKGGRGGDTATAFRFGATAASCHRPHPTTCQEAMLAQPLTPVENKIFINPNFPGTSTFISTRDRDERIASLQTGRPR